LGLLGLGGGSDFFDLAQYIVQELCLASTATKIGTDILSIMCSAMQLRAQRKRETLLEINIFNANSSHRRAIPVSIRSFQIVYRKLDMSQQKKLFMST